MSTTLLSASAAMAASITVHPGESIQAAVDASLPGGVVKVEPGDYTEPGPGPAAIRINKPLKLIAKSNIEEGIRVRILPGPGQTSGIHVAPDTPGDEIKGVLIKGFTVEGFQSNGIWLEYTRNFKIKGNETIDNLHVGIFPTLSAKGLVKKNVSYGGQDAALWVEASENVRVIGNEVHHAPTGLEITISKNIFVKGNDIHDNTVGVGLYHSAASGLPSTGLEGDWTIIGNQIYNNNEPNSAPPGSQAAELLPGIGILLIGPDDNLIQRNTITGNDFLGLAIIDWCLANDCMTNPPEDPETVPENNRIIDNVITGNGGNPPGPPFGGLASDVTALVPPSNCFSGNTIGTSIPAILPEC